MKKKYVELKDDDEIYPVWDDTPNVCIVREKEKVLIEITNLKSHNGFIFKKGIERGIKPKLLYLRVDETKIKGWQWIIVSLENKKDFLKS